MPEPGRGTADYHAKRSDVALIRRDLVEYEKELLEAKRIDPQNKKYDLALATLHVAANDVATHEVGVRELLDLRDDESFRRDAMHRLADDALRRNQKRARSIMPGSWMVRRNAISPIVYFCFRY
jgi:hypothetical protein